MPPEGFQVLLQRSGSSVSGAGSGAPAEALNSENTSLPTALLPQCRVCLTADLHVIGPTSMLGCLQMAIVFTHSLAVLEALWTLLLMSLVMTVWEIYKHACIKSFMYLALY